MTNKNYIIIVDIDDEESGKENEVRIYDSFEKAAKAIRRKVIELNNKWKFFPYDKVETVFCDFEEGVLSEEENETIYIPLNEVIKKIVTDENYEADENLNILEDLDDCLYISANSDEVEVEMNDFCWGMKMNIHSMKDPNKDYYFEYHQDFPEQTIKVLLTKEKK